MAGRRRVLPTTVMLAVLLAPGLALDPLVELRGRMLAWDQPPSFDVAALNQSAAKLTPQVAPTVPAVG